MVDQHSDSAEPPPPSVGLTLALFDRASAGDVRARRAAVERIEARVVDEVRRRLPAAARGHADTMDLAQDLFVTLLKPESRARFSNDDELRRYVTRAISLRVRDQFRVAGRRRVRRDGATRELEQSPADEPGPATRAEDDEQRRAVREAIARLPANEQKVVTMRLLEDRAWAEIAAELGISVEAARSAGRRGVARLGSIISERA